MYRLKGFKKLLIVLILSQYGFFAHLRQNQLDENFKLFQF